MLQWVSANAAFLAEPGLLPSLNACLDPTFDGSTTALFEAPGDACLAQIVSRHLHFDAVADRQARPALAHFAANRGEHEVFVIQFHPEHRPRQHRLDAPFHFNVFFFHRLVSSGNWFSAKGALPPTSTSRSGREKELRPGEPGPRA